MIWRFLVFYVLSVTLAWPQGSGSGTSSHLAEVRPATSGIVNFPYWSSDLGLWLQVDSHAPSDGDSIAVLSAIQSANPTRFLNADQMHHVRRCQQGRLPEAGPLARQYTQCHCEPARRSVPAACTNEVMTRLQTHFRLPASTLTRPLIHDYRAELQTLVLIPRSQLRTARLGPRSARIVEDCGRTPRHRRQRHMQIATPRLQDGQVPESFFRRLRQYFENAPATMTVSMMSPRGIVGEPHIASICSVDRRPRLAHGVFPLDSHGHLAYTSLQLSQLAAAGYIDVSCAPGSPYQRQIIAEVRAAAEREYFQRYCPDFVRSERLRLDEYRLCYDASGTALSPRPEQCASVLNEIEEVLASLGNYGNAAQYLDRLPEAQRDQEKNAMLSRRDAYCHSQARAGTAEFHLFQLASSQDWPEPQRQRALREALDWCASHYCECRGHVILDQVDAYGKIYDDSAADQTLRDAERQLFTSYQGRVEDFVADCPSSQGARTRYIDTPELLPPTHAEATLPPAEPEKPLDSAEPCVSCDPF